MKAVVAANNIGAEDGFPDGTGFNMVNFVNTICARPEVLNKTGLDFGNGVFSEAWDCKCKCESHVSHVSNRRKEVTKRLHGSEKVSKLVQSVLADGPVFHDVDYFKNKCRVIGMAWNKSNLCNQTEARGGSGNNCYGKHGSILVESNGMIKLHDDFFS